QVDDRSLRIAGDLAFDARRKREHDGVRKTERHVERGALHLGAVTGAAELEGLRVTLGRTLHHAGDERPHETLHARGIASAEVRGHTDLGSVDLDVYARGHRP